MMRKVGRFVLGERLGEGGAGTVHLSRDPETGSQIALKLVPLASDADLVAGERRGAELQQQIHRLAPAVAKVLEIGEADGFLYIAMEYVSGPALSSELAERKRLPEHLAVSIACQLCELLEIFHGAAGKLSGQEGPLVHGDVKPDNIRLQGMARVRLLDFGLSQRVEERSHAESDFGSIPYASPERLWDGVLDPAADIWSVAVVLYEMTAGGLPFPGRTEEVIRSRILGGALMPLQTWVNSELAAVLRRCLNADPARRYRSARDLRLALERLAISEPEDVGKTRRLRDAGSNTALSPTSPQSASLGQTPPSSPVVSPNAPPPPSPPRRGHRSFWRWAAAGVISLLVVVFLAAGMRAKAVGEGIEQALQDETRLTVLAKRYVAAERWDVLGLSRKTGERLEKELLSASTAIISAHRAGDPVARELWLKAAELLTLARRIDGDDDDEKAGFYFCQGQLAYLEAVEYASRGAAAAARRSWVNAERYFGEAEKTAIHWGVPWLSLVRLYLHESHGRPEPGKLAWALERADGRLVRLTSAEHLLMIEGYERLGRMEEVMAETLADGEKREKLRAAKARFERALEHCQDLASDRKTCISRCELGATRIRLKLTELG